MGTVLSYVATDDLEASINALSINAVTIGAVVLLILVGLALAYSKRKPKIKLPLFLGILVTVLSTTTIISAGTVYLNVNSFAGGPVHWHADFEVWACGNELELREPQGFLSNKIGTATLHEHNDKRIHLEGVPVTPKDASLGKFMTVVGGQISKDTLVFPLNDNKLLENAHGEEDGDGSGAQAPEDLAPFIRTEADGKVAKFVSGQNCGSDKAEVQVFVYNFDKNTKTYKQTKLTDPASYTISHYSDVPPGDCVIMEFAPRKDRTEKLCRQYGIRDKDKCERFGVEATKRSICEDTEVR
ncbi:MAG TPA: hypothetical protein VFO38_04325 [Candidatus Saccharimonadales bacterium]|nr:hypothetical protein [Candidatus Saccharimonadales bacterium]